MIEFVVLEIDRRWGLTLSGVWIGSARRNRFHVAKIEACEFPRGCGMDFLSRTGIFFVSMQIGLCENWS